MELRTTFKITPSAEKITYNNPVMFIGSCFATSIGRQFETGHLPVMINPSGTVYNPVSVSNTLDTIINNKEHTEQDLYNNNGIWLSFNHYTDFSSDDPREILKAINNRSREAREFISKARFLFITFGTARVYRWKKTGKIVSNCHKLPAAHFSHELLTVDDIVNMWTRQLDRLLSLFPQLKVVFTISPVRHWKDGPHGNQVSKSILILAVEKLLKHQYGPGYFPAYELLMDDLRDYRFYDDDMLNPSGTAISYIWDKFTDCYFDRATLELWSKFVDLGKAFNHQIKGRSKTDIRKFAVTILNQISALTIKVPSVNLSREKDYFSRLKEF